MKKKNVVLESDKCPVCGGELELENGEMDCGTYVYDSRCLNRKCKFAGRTGYTLVFNGHYDSTTGIDYTVDTQPANKSYKEVK